MTNVRVRIPTALRSYANGQAALEVAAATVKDALAGLVSAAPALKPHLFDERGALRSYVNLYLNNEDVRSLQKDATPVKAGDTLLIVPSVAGGSA